MYWTGLIIWNYLARVAVVVVTECWASVVCVWMWKWMCVKTVEEGVNLHPSSTG